MERARRETGERGSKDVGDALLRKLVEASSPLDVGPLSIACGLIGDTRAEETLVEKLRSSSDDEARGYCAIGLGLLGAHGRIDEIRGLIDDATYRPLLLRESAIALGLLGAGDILPVLTAKLRTSRSLAAQTGLAQAIGRIGDAAALPALTELIDDGERPALIRAFAAVALGLVSDRDELPWNTHLSVDANYLAAPATLYDAAGFGILNIL